MVASLRRSAFLALLAVASLSSSARAGGIRIVGPTGTLNFTSLQTAVDYAMPGDVLLVGAGNYYGFTVDKSISIVAAPGGIAQILGTVSILGVPGAGVLLSGLRISPTTSEVGLRILNPSAPVRLQDCVIGGGFDKDAVQVYGGQGVAFVRCAIFGGGGVANFSAGTGLLIGGGAVAVFASDIRGGKGAGGILLGGGDGGTGINSGSSSLYLAGSSVRGGDGGDSQQGDAGWGGAGLLSTFEVRLLDTLVQGGMPGYAPHGNPGQPGTPMLGGPFTYFPGVARKLSAAWIRSDEQALTISVTGEPFDRFLLFHDPAFAHIDSPFLRSVWMIPVRHFLTRATPYVLPANGALQLQFSLSDLPASVLAQRLAVQGLFVDAQNQPILSSPLHVVRLNRDAGPDCNATLIQDYVEVIEGLVPDANTDLIPDACEVPTTRFVDPLAPAGGNGTATSPFNSLRQAFDAAYSGDSIVLADGSYSGADNRDLDFAARTLIVRSANGPLDCFLDCEDLGRAFMLTHGEPRAARIEGLTIVRGNAAAAGGSYGGAVFADGASPTIANCNIVSCRAPVGGGGVALINGSGLVRSSTFLDNHVTGSSALPVRGGGGLLLALGSAAALECLVEYNSALLGGGGIALTGNLAGYYPMAVAHCTLLGNTAVQGGGIVVEGDLDRAIVEGCLLVGNQATRGAAIWKSGSTRLTLSSSTLVENPSPEPGAAIYAIAGSSGTAGMAEVHGSILWGNASPSGQPLFFSGAGTTLTVRSSALEFGLGGVLLQGGASLVWGNMNLASNPLFYDPDGLDNDPLTLGDNDYRLSAPSPCIDSCDSTLVERDWLDVDGDGNTLEWTPLDLDRLPRFYNYPTAPNLGLGPPSTWLDYGAYENQL